MKACALAVLFAMWSSTATAQYQVTLLPPPADSSEYATESYALNNHGQVFGRAFNSVGQRAPILWTNGIPERLQVPAPYLWHDTGGVHFINDAGEVVSAVSPPPQSSGVRPIIWRNGTVVVVPLPPVPPTACTEAASSFPIGFNNAGHLLLSACDRFWIWNEGSFTMLAEPSIPPGCLGVGNFTGLNLNHLNDAGHVVLNRFSFFSGTDCPSPQTGIFTDPNTFVVLPINGRTGQINNRDEVLVSEGSGSATAIRLWNGAEIVELGLGAMPWLNNLGQVVFVSSLASPVPLLYANGAVAPLPLPPELRFPTTTSTYLLNDAGQIAGYRVAGGLTQRALILTPASTTTTLTADPNPSTFGQSVTMTATVTADAGSPGGKVTFYDGTITIGEQVVDDAGRATLNATLTTGTHTLTAFYAANAGFQSSNSLEVMHTVDKASTSSAIVSSPNPSVFGQTVTFTAAVSSPVAVPTGTVTFRDGAVPLGTASLDAMGQATLSTANLATGTHTITAEYGGDSNFKGSTSPGQIQTVNPVTPVGASTTTSLTASPNPVLLGQAVTLTAKVAAGSAQPSGQVTFYDGDSVLGTATLAKAKGSMAATLVISSASFSPGTHTFTATYLGSGSFLSSMSNPVPVTFYTGAKPAGTTTTLTSSANPSTGGQAITFTATVKAAGKNVPSGSVLFYADNVWIGTAPLVAGKTSGTAQLGGVQLVAGTHAVVAIFIDDLAFAASASPALAQVVR